ncbi:MAG: hypothetical protein HQK66_15360 [Desulfamplus sp.]|nr:hypothetical protein [Desulfamplus sp.]
MKPWFKIVKPHKDIQDGHLDESIFAADLAEAAQGRGREIYTNPEIFFKKTCFTAGIKNIAKKTSRIPAFFPNNKEKIMLVSITIRINDPS